MAKQIALNLTINGVKNSITNINQLNAAIKEAEEDLKDIEIGSDNFKKLASEIKNAKNIAEDFQESIKGQDLEKRVGSFAKVGEAVTSSFAGAQAALSLFGAESDDVAKAAAQAQALLTVALAARSAAEGVVAVRTVAQTIATQASAAAANTANVATKALYTTLASNPYGAILAVIGLVVGALITFSSEAKEATNVTKELASVQSGEAEALKQTLNVLTQNTGLRALQRQEIEKLKKEYPGFNAFIDKENKLNEDGIKFINLKIRQYELEADAKFLIQKLSENAIKIAEIEARSALEQVSFWQGALNFLKSGGNLSEAIARDVVSGLEAQKKEIADINKSSEIYNKRLGGIRTELNTTLQSLQPYNQQLTAQAKAEELAAQKADELKKRQEELSKAQKEGRTGALDLSDAIKKLNDAYAKYEGTIQRLNKIDIGTKTVEELNKIKQAREAAAKALVDDVENIKNELEAIAPPLENVFVKTFEQFRKANEDLIILGETGFFKQYGKSFTDFVNTTLADTKKLTQEQKTFLFDLSKGYGDFFDFIQEKGIETFVKEFPQYVAEFDKSTSSGGKGFLKALGDISVAAGDTTLEINSLTKEIFRLDFNRTKAASSAEQTFNKLKVALFEPTFRELARLEGESILEKLVTEDDEVKIAQLQGRLDRIKKALAAGTVDLTLIDSKRVEEQVDKTIVQFQKLLTAIAGADERILSINKQVQDLTKELGNNTEELSQAVGGIILKNIETINKVLFGLRTKEEKQREDFIRKTVSDEEGLKAFRERLAAAGLADSIKNNDDLLQAYIAYKLKEKQITEETEKDKQDAQAKTYQKIQQGFELFSQTLNQISGLVNEKIQTDLESLQIAQQKALENVVGDSEQAAQKRLEIQAEYEAKSKEIEKKGRITSLRFSQAQTIANTAQAVAKALAELGPILGPILAGVNSAIGIAQIAIIEDQISNARSLRRGGVVRAQGGMIIGPSHENGGVRLAQAGIIAEGNESIINRQSTLDYQSLLSSINIAGGGRPLVYNNFDDSRIVEAIAKQQQKPIRAYVLGSEITNEQAISKRLDDLSKI